MLFALSSFTIMLILPYLLFFVVVSMYPIQHVLCHPVNSVWCVLWQNAHDKVHHFDHLKIYLLIVEREEWREKNIELLFHLLMHSFVQSRTCLV